MGSIEEVTDHKSGAQLTDHKSGAQLTDHKSGAQLTVMHMNSLTLSHHITEETSPLDPELSGQVSELSSRKGIEYIYVTHIENTSDNHNMVAEENIEPKQVRRDCPRSW